jgi:two-component system, NarL family, response regulator
VHSYTQKIRVLVADDHAGMREGIGAMINGQSDMVVAGEAADGQDAVEKFKSFQPDVTIMDFNLPIVSGADAIKTIRAEFPEARFLVITAMNDDDCIRQALSAGARSYLHKDMLRRELLPAIRAVHQGRQYLPDQIAKRLKKDH